jgi:hypothetical protein
MIYYLAALILIGLSSTECEMKTVQHLAREAPIIVVGEVDEVERTLGFGSGYSLVVQRVNYQVKEVLKGDLADERINVAHVVVANSPSADIESKQTQLSPKLFAKGNRLILFLKPDPQSGYIGIDSDKPYKGYFALSENCVPLADAEMIKTVRQVVATKAY